MRLTGLQGQIAAWTLGGLQMLLSISLAIWILTLPAAFRIYYPALRISPHTNDAVAVVDWLSTNYRERSLNLALVDRKLEAQELKHFSDVRRVFRRLPLIVSALGFTTALVMLALRPARATFAAAQRRGLVLWLILLATAGGLAGWNWALFFAWIHHPFFGDVSWRLPDDCYSLVLFPTSFWREAVVAVLLAPVLISLVGFLVLRLWNSRLVTRSRAGWFSQSHLESARS